MNGPTGDADHDQDDGEGRVDIERCCVACPWDNRWDKRKPSSGDFGRFKVVRVIAAPAAIPVSASMLPVVMLTVSIVPAGGTSAVWGGGPRLTHKRILI
jgi:hypothetical protein